MCNLLCRETFGTRQFLFKMLCQWTQCHIVRFPGKSRRTKELLLRVIDEKVLYTRLLGLKEVPFPPEQPASKKAQKQTKTTS